MREVREQRVLLQSCRQDAFRHDEQARISGEPALEADLPADLAPERPPALVGNPCRDRPRRHASRLQQDQRSRIEQRRGHTCRLAGAGCRREHDRATAGQVRPHVADICVDRQRFEGRVTVWLQVAS